MKPSSVKRKCVRVRPSSLATLALAISLNAAYSPAQQKDRVPLPAYCTAKSTNDLKSASFDELVFYAQRYGSTPEKTAWKEAARQEVFTRGPQSLSWLIDHAKIDNIMIQVLTEEMVNKLKAEQAVPVLLAELEAKEPRSRRMDAFYLGNYTNTTSEQATHLMPILKDDEAAGAAIRTLGKWKVATAVPQIVPFLKHAKEGRRIVAANALRDIGDPTAAPALIEALADPLFTVRETSARALVALGKPAEKTMIRALPAAKGQPLRALIRALGETKSRAALKALRPYLKDPDPAVRADAEDVFRSS